MWNYSYLVLQNNQLGMRSGLRKADYQGRHLLESFNASNKDNRDKMPPGAATIKSGRELAEEMMRQPVEDDDDIMRPPDSSSDEEADNPADIKRTIFKTTSEEPKPPNLKTAGLTARDRKPGNRTVNGSNGKKRSNGRATRNKSSPVSSQEPNSPKRKSQEDPAKYGEGMEDAFGRVNAKNKRKKVSYGSSSQAALSQKSKGSGLSQESSPKRDFKPPSSFEFENPQKSDAEDMPAFKHADIPASDSPVSTPKSVRKFRTVPSIPDSPPTKEDGQYPQFKKPDLDLSFDDNELPNLGTDTASPTRTRRAQRQIPQDEHPATQYPTFKAYDLGLDGDIAETAQSLLKEYKDTLPFVSIGLTESDDFATMTQLDRCPMCGKAVNPADLRAYGDMNTRQQEKFCRSHQRKTAKEDWTLKGYPEINWEHLNSRISKHHSFIQKLVKGGRSHYRDVLEENVNAGKDRTLLKMTSNLTPGYYGSRGLHVISESIMQKFTSLLKKRAVKDRLMAARGVTGFVQAVLVPEVTVLLITEDMSVSIDEARDILAESAGIGELVHEEIKDVVVRRFDDSENEGDDGYDG